ncbi:MAG: hypothetical protein II956_13400 [Bacteroidales bacterium]|nr:hypothetical protein [Bacteroidales bacterium]
MKEKESLIIKKINANNLIDYLKTLEFITINDIPNGLFEVVFDESVKSQKLHNHLLEYLQIKTINESDNYRFVRVVPSKESFDPDDSVIVKDPVNKLRRVIVTEGNERCRRLSAYLRSLPFVTEIEDDKGKEYVTFKVNLENEIGFSLVDYLKVLEKFVEIALSSPGDIIREFRKGYEILFDICW